MKTQLLEDIGQSAALSLTSSNRPGHSTADKAAQHPAPTGRAQPARPRSALGVWRQKVADEPLVSTPQQPDQPPAPQELHDLFEEIAALEAQFVAPGEQRAPAIAAAGFQHPLPTPPAAPLQSAIPPAEPTLAPDQTQAAAAAQDPLFDFTAPSPALPAARAAGPFTDPTQAATAPHAPLFDFTRPSPARPAAQATDPFPDPPHAATAPQDPLFDFTAPSTASPAVQAADPFTRARPTRSTQRYFVWGMGLLALALLIGGGRWWYQERNDTASLARIADAAKAQPQGGNAVQRQALAARASTVQAGAEVRAAPPVPAIDSSPAVSPLVMLEPDPPAAAKLEQRPPPAADRVARQAARKPEPAAKREAASPLPKRSERVARKESDTPARLAANKARRDPVRQLARAPAIETERSSGPDTGLAATLRACRERGYHATQCVKRGCSVTEYGFACRGR